VILPQYGNFGYRREAPGDQLVEGMEFGVAKAVK
jgi:hypothetical protein